MDGLMNLPSIFMLTKPPTPFLVMLHWVLLYILLYIKVRSENPSIMLAISCSAKKLLFVQLAKQVGSYIGL